MNRLWVRLSLYLGLMVLTGVLLLVGLSRFIVSERMSAALAPVQLRSADGIIDELSDYYRHTQSWGGVEGFMRGVQASMPLWFNRLDFALVDDNGQIVYRSERPADEQDSPGRRQRIATTLPIRVDGRIVGELQLSTRPALAHMRPNQEGDLLGQASRLLLMIGLGGGLLGIVFSVVASRNLTAPLSRLAVAARDIGARNFERRVPIAGSDEVREVAHAFNEMAEQLAEAETLRRNLVADVAHELRTPLSVIQGNLQALLDGVYSLEKSEIARLYTQTRLLSHLVDDLHDLAQAEAGQLVLHRLPVDFAALIDDVVAAHLPAAEAKAITLQVERANELPRLLVDATRISQVIHNLLANALRHTPVDGRITVRLGVVGQQVELQVRDSGEGIRPEDLPHLFERFYRADRSRTRETGNAGLGLAIARAIAQAHGGTIRAQSAGLGQGSTFILNLPVVSSEE